MITMRVTKPKAKNSLVAPALQQGLLDAVEEMGEIIKSDYLKTIATWNHKPAFHQKTYNKRNEVARKTWTNDDTYIYVHDGTDVKYAVMSPDFQPKTFPGVIASFPGKGGVIRMDYQHPRPGIIAREFTDAIIKSRSYIMPRIAEVHLRKAVQKSGYAYP